MYNVHDNIYRDGALVAAAGTMISDESAREYGVLDTAPAVAEEAREPSPFYPHLGYSHAVAEPEGEPAVFATEDATPEATESAPEMSHMGFFDGDAPGESHGELADETHDES